VYNCVRIEDSRTEKFAIVLCCYRVMCCLPEQLTRRSDDTRMCGVMLVSRLVW